MGAFLEVSGHEIPIITVSREGFAFPPRSAIHFSSEKDAEFLDSFLQALINHSLEPNDLVFSGFDGAKIKEVQELPDPAEHIWVMDEATWRKATTHTTPSTPAEYAELYETPCIGLYDKDQLRIVSVVDGEKLAPHQLSDFERRGLDITRSIQALHDEHPDAEIYDPVVHIDHPYSEVSDALRGIAFLEYET